MLDTVAFYGARAGTVAALNVAGLADGHVTVQGNNIIVPAQCNKIYAVYAMSQATVGSLTNGVQLTSPSLRASSVIELSCWNANGAVVAAAQSMYALLYKCLHAGKYPTTTHRLTSS